MLAHDLPHRLIALAIFTLLAAGAWLLLESIGADYYQRSVIQTHVGDSPGLRIVIHHGEQREVLHGGSDRASDRLYGG